MKRRFSGKRLAVRGFTLVEMLVVLAILVLLVGMVAPRVLKSQKKADVNNAKAQLGMFRTCLERYAVDMKDFPTTEQGLQALLAPPESDSSAEKTGEGGEASSSGWDGPYVNQETLPKDPWSNDYQYEYPPTHGKGDYPDIWSFGPDGEDGTEDDIVSWSSSDGEAEGDSNANSDTKREKSSRREPERPERPAPPRSSND
jgi:general secretion pathway protein G